MTVRQWAPAAGILVLMLAGCAGGSMNTPTDQPTPPGPSEPSTPHATPPNPSIVPSARWAAIKDDLVSRGVDGAPALVSAEAVTWRSGALGCPQPGMQYTQSLIDGMQVIVEAAGRRYDYRFGTGDKPLLCEGMHTPPSTNR